MLSERVYRRSAIAIFAALERRVVDELARATVDSMRIRFGLPVSNLDRPDDRVIVAENEVSPEDKVC